ncbi:hypothetical protein Mapa_017728 [Marchantia paleacea]|nr:hypothetical protein Mapa_017728 [Marchantia paleacea]
MCGHLSVQPHDGSWYEHKAGQHLGVIGLGGLGHMAVKFGKEFGLKVTIMSTSESKREEAINVLGADNFVNTSDPAQSDVILLSCVIMIDDLQTFTGDLTSSGIAAANIMHNIIDTIPSVHPLDTYPPVLKTKGTIALVGFPDELKFAPYNLLP